MKIKTLMVSTVLLLGFSSYSLAYPYTVTIDSVTSNVGKADVEEARSDFQTWKDDYGLKGSGAASETAWVNLMLGTSFGTYEVKDSNVVATATNEDDAYGAFKFDITPAYYLIKDGAGADGSTHWLFKNEDSVNWGVVNFENLFGNSWKSASYTISHVTQFGNAITVPEPATLALLFTGVFGLVVARRKQRTES